MTQVLRSTLWESPDGPTHVIVRECDLKSIEETMNEPAFGDMLVTYELFTMDGDVTIEAAILEGSERFKRRADIERNMAIMYYFSARQFRLMSRTGVWCPTDPTPLPTDDLKKVLVAIAVHSMYDRQSVIVTSCTGEIVTLASGTVKT